MAVLDFQSIFDSSFTQIILSICILAIRDLRYFQILSDCSGYCSAIVPLLFRHRSGYRSIGATIGAIGVILVTLLVTTSDSIVTFSMTQCFFYDISMTLISFSMTFNFRKNI